MTKFTNYSLTVNYRVAASSFLICRSCANVYSSRPKHVRRMNLGGALSSRRSRLFVMIGPSPKGSITEIPRSFSPYFQLAVLILSERVFVCYVHTSVLNASSVAPHAPSSNEISVQSILCESEMVNSSFSHLLFGIYNANSTFLAGSSQIICGKTDASTSAKRFLFECRTVMVRID